MSWKRFVNVKNNLFKNLFKTDKWKRFVDVKNNLFKTNKVFEWDDLEIDPKIFSKIKSISNDDEEEKKEEVITGWEYDDPTPCLPTIVES
ncbi:hypothetical protein Golax_008716 [Gossypium laxum]|uniref:Uncharacterized protein n=1 Tax=Gossypium laxum TaxID=34288 RepID=A0A7J9ACA1_9ROSI|nr:hypothetical protein [Gossypium laxum]